MRRLRSLTRRAMQGLARHISPEALAIIGIAATVLLGLPPLIILAAPAVIAPVIVATLLLVVIVAIALVALLASPDTEPRYLGLPYRVDESHVTLDLQSADGREATITFREVIRPELDHMVSIQRGFWGDWNQLSLADLRCDEPVGSQVVDCYQEGHRTRYLISFRRVFNRGDPFVHSATLVVRNGFAGQDEGMEWVLSSKTKRLTIEVIFPEALQRPNDLRHRVSDVGTYEELPLPDSAIHVVDGRIHAAWTWTAPRQHWMYSVEWRWHGAPNHLGPASTPRPEIFEGG